MQQYEIIDLNDYIQTGEGGTAISYSKKDGKTLAKLFSPGIGSETAEREFLVNKIVYEMMRVKERLPWISSYSAP